ncbi:hypothetical protein QC761_701430 [Podospora bellae-mahoneyi]|uniref:Uncharacterized protein n=1 Tax=Podospora bellae-mahoneyi TaxID=2093777 RepID=A0ABR0F9R6_9PEZI|nr:hypothetical protein QC761_701430 [Podospora bellae-mahoneyi]
MPSCKPACITSWLFLDRERSHPAIRCVTGVSQQCRISVRSSPLPRNDRISPQNSSLGSLAGSIWGSCPFVRPSSSTEFHVGVEGERRGGPSNTSHPATPQLSATLEPHSPQPGLTCSARPPNRAALVGRVQTDKPKPLLLLFSLFFFSSFRFCSLSFLSSLWLCASVLYRHQSPRRHTLRHALQRLPESRLLITRKSTKSSLSSSSSSKSKHSHSSDNHEEGGHKIPYVFLGSIAAASFLAHKYWPKGYVYGDKEDWELSKYERRAREKLQAAKAAKRGKVKEREVKSYSPPPPAHDGREARRGGYAYKGPPPVSHRREVYKEQEEGEVYSNPGSRRGSLRGAAPRGRIDPRGYYNDDDREYTRGLSEYAVAPSVLRSKSQSGGDQFYSDVAPSRDRSLPPRRASSVANEEYYMTPAIGPAASRNRDSHYPPPPPRSYVSGRELSRPRYLIEEPRAGPSLLARPESMRGRELQRRPYYDEEVVALRAPREEVVYLYRDAPSARSRRASVDLGAGRNRAFDWDYR